MGFFLLCAHSRSWRFGSARVALHHMKMLSETEAQHKEARVALAHCLATPNHTFSACITADHLYIHFKQHWRHVFDSGHQRKALRIGPHPAKHGAPPKAFGAKRHIRQPDSPEPAMGLLTSVNWKREAPFADSECYSHYRIYIL